MKPLTEALLENSKSAIISCIELHNKPTFEYRYEVCTILAINGWELLLKALIVENHPDIKLIKRDGTTKPFEECLKFISSQKGKSFRTIEENLLRLYEYRNNIIHFYKDPIDIILYSLLHKSVIFYNNLIKDNFNINLAEETNLFLMPIGFKPITSPIDFLSNESELKKSSYAVQQFVKNIITSTELLTGEGIEESILTGFNVAVINENRINNADIIVGITKNKDEANLVVNKVIGKEIEITSDATTQIRIEEETVFKTIYLLSYKQVIDKCRLLYSDFKQNARFNRIMRSVKENPTYHKKRYLDFRNRTGTGKDWYSQSIFEVLNEHYNLK